MPKTSARKIQPLLRKTAAHGFPELEPIRYDDARPEIKNGDILLCSGNYKISKLIQKVTDSPWSHVAFVLRLDQIDRIMVLESIEGRGVRTIPLSEYVHNFEGSGTGYDGRFCLARHNGMVKVTNATLKTMMEFAADLLGRSYDNEEIERILTRIVGHKLGMPAHELKRNDDYICSEYVYECYQRLGIDIACHQAGFIAPANFANDPNITLLHELVP
jgi:hypothetical protein